MIGQSGAGDVAVIERMQPLAVMDHPVVDIVLALLDRVDQRFVQGSLQALVEQGTHRRARIAMAPALPPS